MFKVLVAICSSCFEFCRIILLSLLSKSNLLHDCCKTFFLSSLQFNSQKHRNDRNDKNSIYGSPYIINSAVKQHWTSSFKSFGYRLLTLYSSTACDSILLKKDLKSYVDSTDPRTNGELIRALNIKQRPRKYSPWQYQSVARYAQE